MIANNAAKVAREMAAPLHNTHPVGAAAPAYCIIMPGGRVKAAVREFDRAVAS
jgi:hypothetical protein